MLAPSTALHLRLTRHDMQKQPVADGPPLCRIAVFGPMGHGKSNLTIRFTKDIFIGEYDPTSALFFAW